mmetsp:Transcript_5493/g.33950  ORF Transcript_5493/g.33950 Transcript_5493/m.33950 type:complete len:264 (+) Transcript_5493:1678-2469(+)
MAFASRSTRLLALVHAFLGLPPLVYADLLFFLDSFFGQSFGHRLVLPWWAAHQHQEVLLGFGAVWIVHQESATESHFHGGGGEHVCLSVVFRIKLEDCSASSCEASIQGSKEGGDSFSRILFAGLCVAKPLDGADGHRTVEDSWSKRQSVSEIHRRHLARSSCVRRFCIVIIRILRFVGRFDVDVLLPRDSFSCLVLFLHFFHGLDGGWIGVCRCFGMDVGSCVFQHVLAEIYADPFVSALFQHASAHPCATSYVQQVSLAGV